MQDLFRVHTNNFSLDWRCLSKQRPNALSGKPFTDGYFRLSTRTSNCELLPTTWKAFPKPLAEALDIERGPALFEQTEYQIYLRATRSGDKVRLVHRDPFITSKLTNQEDCRVLHGTLNFRGQIGRSTFTVLVNDKPQLDIDVEVFPTKIDYETDYKEIVADLQDVVRSLAYEYLRSTYQLGKLTASSKPSQLEWLLLLRAVLDDLEKAINHIVHQPRRRLERRNRVTRIERIKKIDAGIRSQIRRGKGRGSMLTTSVGPIRERLIESPPESTLDTPEHRWLKRQVSDIQQTLANLLRSANNREPTDRQTAVTAEISSMERRVNRMVRAEPFRDADGEVTAGFASLQLLSAPGYREAYQACMLLKMGLRLEGETFRVSVKDLNVLYEYWVFFAMVKIIRDEYGANADFGDLFRIRRSGINVGLTKGRKQKVRFTTVTNRRIEITYNPEFGRHETTLIPQKPDILISCEKDGWPQIQLICDAKYRIDNSEQYRTQFGAYGPPQDAINVLHRYRDAILEIDENDTLGRRPKRSVIQAAALFPYNESTPGEFRKSRLWTSIERLGIGAIPALPSELGYLREWLISALQQGGWAMSDRVISHAVEERAVGWRIAASEPVLVGVLDPKNAQERLDWITNNQTYYVRLPKTPHRHFRVVSVALYCPRPLRKMPAIAFIADVEEIEIVKRSEIITPWKQRGTPDQRMIAYRLKSIRPISRPVENRDGNKTSFRQDRWTSRLGIARAKSATEIGFETEPEWRLYEFLQTHDVDFTVRLDSAKLASSNDPAGRAWFQLANSIDVRYDGANGFLLKNRLQNSSEFVTLSNLRKRLLKS